MIRSRPASPGAAIPGALALFVAALLTTAAAPPPTARWVFDRLTWSPAGDSLALEARRDDGPGDSAPLVLVVDASTGRFTTPPEARAFQLSPDGRSLLLLGSSGLWWFDPASGAVSQVYFHPPGGGPRVYDFAFRRDGAGALLLTGAPGDTGGALWVTDGPGRELVHRAPYRPGTPPPAEWNAVAFAPEPAMKMIGRGPRQLTVPGTSLRLDYDGRTLQIEGGTAANRVRLEDVEPEWVAWPSHPGLQDLALLALAGSGAGAPAHLYRVGAGPDLKPLLDRLTPQGIWVDDRIALVNDDLGRLYRYDAASDTLSRLALDHRPAWAQALAEPARVFTLKVERWPRSARQFKAQEALLQKCARELPGEARAGAQAFGRRLEGSNRCVGVFASLAAAAAAAPAFEAAGLTVEPGVVEAREMTGEFTYGKSVAAETGVTAWCRRAGAGPVELWIERPGEPAHRILTGELRP